MVATSSSRIMESVLDNIKASKHNQLERPYVSLAFAQSLDGSISTKSGEVLHLSNQQSLLLTHQLRAVHDGILVGINTVLSDDPRLNVRLTEGKDPIPIVLDSQLRTPLNARLITASKKRLIIFTSFDADKKKEKALIERGVKVIRLEKSKCGKLDIKKMLWYLKSKEINSLMVEGGACVLSSFLTSGLAEQVILTICPIFVGGLRYNFNYLLDFNARPALKNIQIENKEGDVIVRGDFNWT